MEVIFYKFKKRINSTKRPSGGTPINVFLKEPTDMHKPVLRLANVKEGTYNYFQIGSRYYFVNSEVVTPNNWLEIGGQLDAMATCADDIKATTAFVERSGAGTNTLKDSLAPPTSVTTTLLNHKASIPNLDLTGSFIVSIANMISPLSMSVGEFVSLYNRLHTEDVVEQIQDFFSNFDDYVTGAIWIPFPKGQVATSGTLNLKAGKIDLGISASIADTTILRGAIGVALPLGGSILTTSSYCTMSVQLPFVGIVHLAVDDFLANNNMVIDYTFDVTSGTVLYNIQNGSGSPVASFGGSGGVPIAVGSTSYNVGAVGGGAVTAMSSLLTGNPVGAVAGLGAIATSILQSSTSTNGASGSRASFGDLSVRVVIEQRGIPEVITTKTTVIGLPTYRTLSLGSLSGYVQCINTSIESEEDFDIVNQCNSFLNSGAYIE